MRCKEFESDIHVYSELSGEEKKIVDAHLENCASCQALFQEVRHMQNIVGVAAEKKALPLHAAKLTSDIMHKINGNSMWNWRNALASFAQNRSVKFSLSIVSSVLILSFLFELSDSLQQKEFTGKIEGAVILNARAFREGLSKRKIRLHAFSECRSPFRSNQYFVDCAKGKIK
jgi:hypothetical protein